MAIRERANWEGWVWKAREDSLLRELEGSAGHVREGEGRTRQTSGDFLTVHGLFCWLFSCLFAAQWKNVWWISGLRDLSSSSYCRQLEESRKQFSSRTHLPCQHKCNIHGKLTAVVSGHKRGRDLQSVGDNPCFLVRSIYSPNSKLISWPWSENVRCIKWMVAIDLKIK